MATSVKLYYTNSTILGDKWELIPSKLLVVDNLEDYLATKTYKNITDFQYVKNELELSINVDISQEYSQPRSTTNFKYVSIQNYGELVHYYFVKKATWRSKTCVRFDLVMDVLNTFQEGRDFNFKANTRIVREHKDRFSKRVQDRFIEFTLFTYVETGTISVNDDIIVYDRNNANVLEGTLVSLTLDPELHSGKVNIKISSNETRTDEEIRSALYLLRLSTLTFKKDNSNYLAGTLTALSQVSHTYKYWRKIDIVNEGLSPVLQCETAVGNKIENPNTTLRQNWYLLYRNQDDPSDSLTNPVNCYLIPENNVKTDAAYIVDGRLVPSFLEEGKYYYFDVAVGQSYTLSNGVVLSQSNPSALSGLLNHRTLVITKAGGKLSVIVVDTRSSTSVPVEYFCEARVQYDDIDYIDISPYPAYYQIENSFLSTLYSTYNALTYPEEFDDSGSYNEVDNINNLDRGDPKNIKLIKLPYVPYNFEVVSAVLQIDDDDTWEYTSFSQQSGGIIHVLKLKDMNSALSFTQNIPAYQPLGKLYVGDLSPSLTDNKGVAGDSKLYHSDFYQPTYVYDSFTYKVQLEKLNEALYNATNVANLNITFDMTRTINSRFMFTFNNLYFKLATENYAKYMPIARNNEEVLFNVPYINFIKNGFNYEVKAKNLQNASNMAGIALSGASTLVALAFPSAPLKVAGVVAGLVSMAMSIKSTAVSAQQSEDNLQRKLQEARNQAASVAGSDDVDLMSVYAENRLKYLVYEPTPLMKSILLDLFFYAGYASGRMGKPNHNTRVNFDYLECEASLENEGSIPDECVQELINCFKTGVCYLHKTTRVSDKWDFDQIYENWEKSVMED